MTIGSNNAVEFFGTATALGNSSSAVATTAFSVAADVNQWANSLDALYASIVLSCTFSVAPTEGATIDLLARLIDVVGTGDMQVPASTWPKEYMGTFLLAPNTSIQYIPIEIALPNVKTAQIYEFYVRNNSTQSLPAGWDLQITAKAVGPKA